TPSGSVKFTIDSDTVGTTVTVDPLGVATLPPVFLTAGPHTIHASYNSNGYFVGSTATDLPLNVLPASTTTTVSVLPASPTYGETVSVTAHGVQQFATAPPTGKAQFTVDSNPPVLVDLTPQGPEGVATLLLSNLSAGPHLIQVSYQSNS